MKDEQRDALRWLDQAEHDFEVARGNFSLKFYSDSCFMCEQAAEKAMKSYLIYKGKRFIMEHSIQELAKLCMGYDREFEEVVEMGMVLDRYYILTRYPNALAPPAVPYKSYTKKDASEAISLTERIIEAVKKKIAELAKK